MKFLTFCAIPYLQNDYYLSLGCTGYQALLGKSGKSPDDDHENDPESGFQIGTVWKTAQPKRKLAPPPGSSKRICSSNNQQTVEGKQNVEYKWSK